MESHRRTLLHPTFRTIGQTSLRRSKIAVAGGRTFGTVWSAEGPARRRHDNAIFLLEEVHESDVEVLSGGFRARRSGARSGASANGKHPRPRHRRSGRG